MKREPGVRAEDHFGGFNRRMWAATVDSLLVMIFIVPLMEMGFSAVYPMPELPMSVSDLSTQIAAHPGVNGAVFFLQTMYEHGLITRWLVDTLLQTLVFLALAGFCWKCWSTTPGKKLFRMKIVDAETGGPISNGQILMRLWGYVVSSLPLLAGFFWIAADRRRQGWHDKMAGTVVVIVPRTTPDSEAARP